MPQSRTSILIGKSINGELQELPTNLPYWRAENLEVLVEHAPLRADLHALRSTMTMDVGIVKNSKRLRRAKRRVIHLEGEGKRIWESCKPTQDLVELRNLIEVAKLVVDASIERKQNVGLHYNQDLENYINNEEIQLWTLNKLRDNIAVMKKKEGFL